jgi:hypothetical protein
VARFECATGERSVLDYVDGYRQAPGCVSVYDPLSALEDKNADVCLFGVCLVRRGDYLFGRSDRGAPPKLSLASGALPPRKFCKKLKGTYPSPRACKFVGKIDRYRASVIEAGIARALGENNIRVLMRTYILAIATAALFAIPTAALSEDIYIGPGGVRIGHGYGYHRYYNRYERGRCAELRQACLHKEELGEVGMGNCQRYRAMCR